ncbi:MAG: type II secretion system protein [Candidatus Paceibacteria bacterium]
MQFCFDCRIVVGIKSLLYYKYKTTLPLVVNYKHKYKAGFTLIELLVVIAIIGILASVVLSSLSSARAAAKDAKIISEIRQFQTALELFANANGGLYPADAPDRRVDLMTASCTNCNMLPYINPLPSHPDYTGTNDHRYRFGSGRTGYSILIRLSRNNDAWCRIDMNGGHSSWNHPFCF